MLEYPVRDRHLCAIFAPVDMLERIPPEPLGDAEIYFHRLRLNFAVCRVLMTCHCIYRHQPNRLGVWGFVSCGFLVQYDYYCLSMVVNSLTICGDEMRGYIPNIVPRASMVYGKHWEIRVGRITVDGQRTSGEHTFYSRDPSLHRETAILDQVRVFPAAESLASINSPSLIVKVSWMQAVDEPGTPWVSKELYDLCRISRVLAPLLKNAGFNIVLPWVLAGGPAAATLNGVTRDISADHLYTAEESPFVSAFGLVRFPITRRQLVLTAITPYAEPLSLIGSATELYCVLTHALVTIHEISRLCDRAIYKITTETIWIVRDQESGTVQSMLLDCEIPNVDQTLPQLKLIRDEMLAFATVSTILQKTTPRCVKETYESLLYVVCWLATFGVNQEDQIEISWIRHESNISTGHFPILVWICGDRLPMSLSKTAQLSSFDVFTADILDHFAYVNWDDHKRSGYILLRNLAIHIFQTFIQTDFMNPYGSFLF
ncbi:hypothetical protein BX661DRAFT_173490 [Kickxella alabastrina]|uniref:uncharacterized protein n=1 Tax=Kickxella alabastrina TaxID=61397 RepID=UPI00221F4179|nr:uncharacterized protein BX661DRAFT_173490 [Kickxella alabastrina]KAI7820886.1 hypothetical protein BX661DRAFT_173490 [Kickxella alabastrina]